MDADTAVLSPSHVVVSPDHAVRNVLRDLSAVRAPTPALDMSTFMHNSRQLATTHKPPADLICSFNKL